VWKSVELDAVTFEPYLYVLCNQQTINKGAFRVSTKHGHSHVLVFIGVLSCSPVPLKLSLVPPPHYRRSPHSPTRTHQCLLNPLQPLPKHLLQPQRHPQRPPKVARQRKEQRRPQSQHQLAQTGNRRRSAENCARRRIHLTSTKVRL